MDEERRKAVRVQATLFVQYRADSAQGAGNWDITTVKDISESGVSIQTGKVFEKNSPISLRFKIPSRPFEMTEVSGKVVGSSQIGQGTTYFTRVEFRNMSDDIKMLFHEYVTWAVKNQGHK